MPKQKKSWSDAFVTVVATGCGAGSVPFVPGTAASAAVLAAYMLLLPGPVARLVIPTVFLALGLVSGGRAEKLLGTKDDKRIVIDEFCGMAIGLANVGDDYVLMLIGFLLFRILDTLKVFPAGGLQRLRGSAGIMIDDVIAGAYTSLILLAISYLNSF
ncbi:MAG: phosphatidylglycerophosphatase A [Candidatus Omnitrophica bacterium]|nr:phosphatidylglycerophosphatase A [Candidatus Omnitrophota bacterium]